MHSCTHASFAYITPSSLDGLLFYHIITCSLLSPRVQGNPTYDVLLQSPDPTATATATASSPSSITVDARKEEDATERELAGLSASSLSALQPFELDQRTENIEAVAEAEVALAAERLKDGGNTLFKLGDTGAAAEMFARVLRTLERAPVVGKSRAGRRGWLQRVDG